MNYCFVGKGPELPEQLYRPGKLIWRHSTAGHCGTDLQGMLIVSFVSLCF